MESDLEKITYHFPFAKFKNEFYFTRVFDTEIFSDRRRRP